MCNLLLLSGGLDSTALAALLRPEGCLTVNYGQKSARAEIEASSKICQELSLSHFIITVPIIKLGLGDMSSSPSSDLSPHSEFWPFRNQFLITIGAMYAAKHKFSSVSIGTVSTDRRHKDGSLEFVKMINSLVKIQEGGISILAPSIDKDTYQLIEESGVPLDILAWAHSCHVSNTACGQCRGCEKHTYIMHKLGWNR